jgi:alkanesulfonate monooxygenase SsuD/methylene tetrahydromethanopterin reductase-like flavin-dependent oxidoreductase (luciferase family)
MSHWFGGSIDQLKRKTAILEGYCAEIGRDPSQIVKTLGAPLLLVENEREAEELRKRIPPERLSMMGSPTNSLEQAAERMQPYIDAGFRGFTFGNPNLNTPQKLALAGQLKKMLK